MWPSVVDTKLFLSDSVSDIPSALVSKCHCKLYLVISKRIDDNLLTPGASKFIYLHWKLRRLEGAKVQYRFLCDVRFVKTAFCENIFEVGKRRNMLEGKFSLVNMFTIVAKFDEKNLLSFWSFTASFIPSPQEENVPTPHRKRASFFFANTSRWTS